MFFSVKTKYCAFFLVICIVLSDVVAAQSNSQGEDGICEAGVNYDEQEGCAGTVSSVINNEKVISNNEIETLVSGEPKKESGTKDEQIKVDESSFTLDDDFKKLILENAGDWLQSEEFSRGLNDAIAGLKDTNPLVGAILSSMKNSGVLNNLHKLESQIADEN